MTEQQRKRLAKKLQLYSKSKDLANFENSFEIVSLLEKLANTIVGVEGIDAIKDRKKYLILEGKRGFKGDKGEQGIKGDKGERGDRGIDGRDGADGRDGQDANITEIITRASTIASELAEDALRPLIPTAETIRAEMPPKEELKVSSIKGLKRRLDRIAKRLDELKKQKVQVTAGGGGDIGGHVRYYDLSGSLNGVLKVFTLPAFARVLSVQSSSFPNAFRETTDYVVDGSAFTITFTSEIDAATTLATGQTITILYATL